MKWLSTKTHRPPSNAGECFVCTQDFDLFIATYAEDDEDYNFQWIGEDGHPVLFVTHFIIPDALELDGEE